MTITAVVDRKLGSDDIAWGVGSFTYTDVNGVVHTIPEVNASQMPLTFNSQAHVTDAIGWIPVVGDLAANVNGAGSAVTTFYLPSGNFSLTANLTIPATQVLRVERGATITVPNGVTLTIDGGIDAGPYQIFNCTGTGQVVCSTLCSSKTIYFYPQWWGADPTGTSDSAAAFQSMVNALDSARIRIEGTFKILSSITVTSPNLQWEGGHNYVYNKAGALVGLSEIFTTGAITVFKISTNAWGNQFRYIHFIGSGNLATGGGLDTSTVMFQVKDLANTANLNLDDFTLDSCAISGCQTAVLIHARNSKFINTDFTACKYGIYIEGLYTNDNRDMYVRGCKWESCGQGGPGATAICIYAHPTAQFRNIQILGNEFRACDYAVYGSLIGLIANNVIDQGHAEAFYIDNSALGIATWSLGTVIIGNVIYQATVPRSSTNGVTLIGPYLNFINNYVAASNKHGLDVSQPSMSKICGNIFADCCFSSAANYSGVNIEASAYNLAVTNNTFFRNITQSLIYNGITNASPNYIKIYDNDFYNMVNADVVNTGGGTHQGSSDLGYLTYTGATPVGNVTPNFIGQDLLLLNGAAYEWWKSYGLTNALWLKLTP